LGYDGLKSNEKRGKKKKLKEAYKTWFYLMKAILFGYI
jgi:hypothetical protein